jgi:hypothetical protein
MARPWSGPKFAVFCGTRSRFLGMSPALSGTARKFPRPIAKVVGHNPQDHPACALGGGAERWLPPTYAPRAASRASELRQAHSQASRSASYGRQAAARKPTDGLQFPEGLSLQWREGGCDNRARYCDCPIRKSQDVVVFALTTLFCQRNICGRSNNGKWFSGKLPAFRSAAKVHRMSGAQSPPRLSTHRQG